MLLGDTLKPFQEKAVAPEVMDHRIRLPAEPGIVPDPREVAGDDLAYTFMPEPFDSSPDDRVHVLSEA